MAKMTPQEKAAIQRANAALRQRAAKKTAAMAPKVAADKARYARQAGRQGSPPVSQAPVGRRAKTDRVEYTPPRTTDSMRAARAPATDDRSNMQKVRGQKAKSIEDNLTGRKAGLRGLMKKYGIGG